MKNSLKNYKRLSVFSKEQGMCLMGRCICFSNFEGIGCEKEINNIEKIHCRTNCIKKCLEKELVHDCLDNCYADCEDLKKIKEN